MKYLQFLVGIIAGGRFHFPGNVLINKMLKINTIEKNILITYLNCLTFEIITLITVIFLTFNCAD